MSKKNKDIEVRIEEKIVSFQGKKVEAQKLFIGKKHIGSLLPIDGKKWSVQFDGRSEAVVKTAEEGIEYIIRQWNLND